MQLEFNPPIAAQALFSWSPTLSAYWEVCPLNSCTSKELRPRGVGSPKRLAKDYQDLKAMKGSSLDLLGA